MGSPVNKLSDVLMNHFDESKQNIFTSLPARVISYNPSTQTCTAQPVFKTGELQMPPVYHVPVIFPSGGGAVMTFPVKAGDRVWLSYSMYPIDEYISGSGDTSVDTNMTRTHDMSECVAFVGMGTIQKNYSPDPDKVMIRFGSTKWTMDDQGNAVLEGNLHVTKKLTVDDTIVATNEITGKDFVSSTTGITFNGHRHHYFWTDGSGDADTEAPQ